MSSCANLKLFPYILCCILMHNIVAMQEKVSIVPEWVKRAVPVIQLPWVATIKQVQLLPMQQPQALLRDKQPHEILAAFDAEVKELRQQIPLQAFRLEKLQYIMHLFYKEAIQRGLPIYWNQQPEQKEVPAVGETPEYFQFVEPEYYPIVAQEEPFFTQADEYEVKKISKKRVLESKQKELQQIPRKKRYELQEQS